MTKRFFDSDKFKDKWYRKLTPVQKCIWEYAISECNIAGILNFDVEMVSFFINAEITEKDLEIFKDRFQYISDDLIFIPKFVLFQQKISSLDELNPLNNAHKSILAELKKYKIKPLRTPTEPPADVLTRTPDKGRGKGIGNSKGIGKEENQIKSIMPEFSAYGEYGNVWLTQMQRNKIDTMTIDKQAAIDLINDLSRNIARDKTGKLVFNPEYPDMHLAELEAYWYYRQKNKANSPPSNNKKSAAQIVNEVLENV